MGDLMRKASYGYGMRMMSEPDCCVELLRKMVGFDTVNSAISLRPGAEAPLAEFLESYARSLNLATQHLPVDEHGGNLLVSHQVSPGAPWLLFVSHLDTVSADNMTVDPFAGSVRDGRMYGRGACDTKSSGAAMLCALNDYQGCSEQPHNVAILFTVDEEITKSGAKAFVHRHLETLGWRPAGAIVGEPTELRPVVAHNGLTRWSISTQGVAAHSSDPTQGRSAISMMVKVIQAMETQYIPGLQAFHPLTGKAQCSVNVIRGGTQVNIIADTCEIELDRRVVPGESPEDVLPAVQQLLDRLRRDDPNLNVSQSPPFTDPPLDPAGHEKFISFVRTALAKASLPDELTGAPYGTEASTFGEVGIPAVVLGPGCIAQAHTHDEWIALDQFHRAVELYLQLMHLPLETAS
jgi:acetylornithine deacetylase